MAAQTPPLVRQAGQVVPALSGVASGTRIRTLDGILPVEYLTPGDRIVTRAGARRLMSLSATSRRVADLVCIRAGTLGHDRPDSDLWLAPRQRLLIRDWRARALYGRDVAAIPASRLIDDEFIFRAARREQRLFTLRFQDDEVIWAEGLELACPALDTAEIAPMAAAD
jgi:hypothetical protein